MRSSSAFRSMLILFVALGSFTYGYAASIISTTLAQPSFVSYFALDKRQDASNVEGAINGLFQAGGLFGALSCIATADWLGRRKAIFIGAVISVIGGALQAGSVDIAEYIAMRFITGVGIGALVVLIPLYQSEISPAKIRGLLVGTHGACICTGYSISSWIGLGFYFVSASGAQWRIPLALQCVAPLILSCGIMYLPESPRWLLARDRTEEAYRSFCLTQVDDENADEEALRNEFQLLRAQLIHEKHNAVSFIELFRRPSLRKRCMIGFLTMFGAQGTATLVINNYGPLLYGNLGFDNVLQIVMQAAWITVGAFGNAINALLVDRIGRVRMLMFGFAGCVIALVGECITLSIFQRTGQKEVASAAVFFLFLHIGCFSISTDATSYVYASEIFPTPVRAKGLSVSISGLFIATILFLQSAPTAFDQIGWKYYLVFICVTSVIFVCMWLFFPETRQKSLEDIAVLFGDSEETLETLETLEKTDGVEDTQVEKVDG
ncbi:hypothetical protein DTO207G8_2502 [Paecilomyces variotii]|nr:hypothetical protein DTO207G8_2502 [Paecilomyces variotii]